MNNIYLETSEKPLLSSPSDFSGNPISKNLNDAFKNGFPQEHACLAVYLAESRQGMRGNDKLC